MIMNISCPNRICALYPLIAVISSTSVDLRLVAEPNSSLVRAIEIPYPLHVGFVIHSPPLRLGSGCGSSAFHCRSRGWGTDLVWAIKCLLRARPVLGQFEGSLASYSMHSLAATQLYYCGRPRVELIVHAQKLYGLLVSSKYALLGQTC